MGINQLVGTTLTIRKTTHTECSTGLPAPIRTRDNFRRVPCITVTRNPLLPSTSRYRHLALSRVPGKRSQVAEKGPLLAPNTGHHLVGLVRHSRPGHHPDRRSRHEEGSRLEEGPRMRRRRRLAGRNLLEMLVSIVQIVVWAIGAYHGHHRHRILESKSAKRINKSHIQFVPPWPPP